MTKKLYSSKGFKNDEITAENIKALQNETYDLAEQLIDMCRAYAAKTGRDLSHHPHLAEYAEISMQAALVVVAGSASCKVADEEAQEDLDRAIFALRWRFNNARAEMKKARGLNIVRKHDVN